MEQTQSRRSPEPDGGSAETSGRRFRMLVVMGALLIALPALLQGRPFVYPDSQQYYQIGRGILDTLGAAVSTPGAAHADAPGAIAQDAAPSGETEDGYMAAIGGGRSPFYAVLVYLSAHYFGGWLLVALQALAASWLILRVIALFRPAPDTLLTARVCAGAAFLTPLGYFAGVLMPDIFGGFLVLAVVLLAFSPRSPRLSVVEQVALWAILAASMMAHGANLLLGAAVLAALGLSAVLKFRGLSLRSSAAGVAAAMAFAVAVNTAYGVAVEKIGGQSLRAPPYLLARVVADGTGAEWLDRHCAGGLDDPAACLFRGYPYVDHNDLLWGTHGAPVTFSSLPPSARLRIQEEEKRTVLAAVMEQPLRQAMASAGNSLRQFVAFDMLELQTGAAQVLRLDGGVRRDLLADLPGMGACAEAPERCSGKGPVMTAWRLWLMTSSLVLLATLLAAQVVLMRRRPSAFAEADRERLRLLFAFLLVMLAANALACGALSGVHSRYQARLIWIIPVAFVAAGPYLSGCVLRGERTPKEGAA